MSSPSWTPSAQGSHSPATAAASFQCTEPRARGTRQSWVLKARETRRGTREAEVFPKRLRSRGAHTAVNSPSLPEITAVAAAKPRECAASRRATVNGFQRLGPRGRRSLRQVFGLDAVAALNVTPVPIGKIQVPLGDSSLGGSIGPRRRSFPPSPLPLSSFQSLVPFKGPKTK